MFLYLSEPQTTRDSTYDAIRKARIQLLWISEEYLDPNPNNHVTLHEFANAIFTWARSQGMSVDPGHFKDLPETGDQTVVVVYQDGETFSFLSDFWDRAHAALDAMARHHTERAKKLLDEGRNAVSETKHREKFRTASELCRAFCTFYVGQWANQSLLLSTAPNTDAERDALVDRLVHLLSRPTADAGRG